jgi:hypothetical protein
MQKPFITVFERLVIAASRSATGLKQNADQAASRFLPLARLRLMTRRPALVDILFLNPWVRARLILLGWYVRFMS